MWKVRERPLDKCEPQIGVKLRIWHVNKVPLQLLPPLLLPLPLPLPLLQLLLPLVSCGYSYIQWLLRANILSSLKVVLTCTKPHCVQLCGSIKFLILQNVQFEKWTTLMICDELDISQREFPSARVLNKIHHWIIVKFRSLVHLYWVMDPLLTLSTD